MPSLSLSLPLSLSQTQSCTVSAWHWCGGISCVAPSIVLAVNCTHLQHTYLFLSFGEMFQWRKSLVCSFDRQLCRFGDCTHAAVYCAGTIVDYTHATIYCTWATIYCNCTIIYCTLAATYTLRNRKKICKMIQLTRVSIIYKQMAAVNFLHFYFVKWFVKMDRKITSNIRFEKI